MRQSIIRNERVSQVQPPQMLQSRQALQHIIGGRRIAQVQALEIREDGKREVLDATLRQPDLLQVRQGRQMLETLVLHIHVRQKMEAEMELLKTAQRREELQFFVRVEAAAGARIPAWTR